MLSNAEVDARFVEIVWCYYNEMLDELTAYANRELERIQDRLFGEA